MRAAELSEDPPANWRRPPWLPRYAGDRTGARQLLARARAAQGAGAGLAVEAYLAYAAGEVTTEPAEAAAHYTRAIELARSCGATFVEGVATVGLAAVCTSVGDAQ